MFPVLYIRHNCDLFNNILKYLIDILVTIDQDFLC